DYIISLGIDVTTEFTCREAHFRNESVTHPNRKLLYASAGEDMSEVNWEDVPIRTLGRIPASWWTSQVSARECMEIPPALYSGHLTDKKLLAVFYGAMHGEDIWMKYGTDPDVWSGEFIRQFCTLQLPYFYLNRLKREKLETDGEDYTVTFSDGVVSYGKDGVIAKNGVRVKDGSDVLLPLDSDASVFIAYSGNGKDGEWDIPDARSSSAEVFLIGPTGNKPCGKVFIHDGRVRLRVDAGCAVALKMS
ncbi:MAG: hypothetical protein K6C36_08695, partial [Clostridia bacterium]|nr:hypothetical protein [Clostridia bacterium]